MGLQSIVVERHTAGPVWKFSPINYDTTRLTDLGRGSPHPRVDWAWYAKRLVQSRLPLSTFLTLAIGFRLLNQTGPVAEQLTLTRAKSTSGASETRMPYTWRFARGVLRLVVLGITLQLLLTLVSRLNPLVELAAHFSFHSLLIGLAVLPCVWLLRMKRSFVLGLVVSACLAWLIAPWNLIPRQQTVDPNFTSSLKVLSWNLLQTNRSMQEIAQLIRDVSPDVLILIEVSPGMLERLLPLLDTPFEQQLAQPDWQGGGIAVLTRSMHAKLKIHEFGYRARPAIVARFETPGSPEPLQLIALHTFSPSPVSRTKHRDQQLDNFIQWSNAQPGPLCTAGDLNTTPWTACFGRIVRSGFRDSRLGAGNCPSWPSGLGMAGIPIDHALTKGNCQITDRRVLPAGPGSDHLPIAFTVHF